MFERFWERVEKGDGCWIWTGCLNHAGYGVVSIMKQPERAHRVAYVLTYGAIPDGLDVMHRCDRTACVRPSHLKIGTRAENEQDKWEKGRGALPMTIGENNGAAKLTTADVGNIRHRYEIDGISQRALAKDYGVSQSQIGRIVRGELWKQST